MKIERKTARAAVPTMAMGDIAFNLLIFFFILARATDDSHLQWQPARAEILKNSSTAKASVVIDRERKVHLNGQQIGVASLKGRIEDLLGDAPAGQRTVLLKVHNDTPALNFEPVIEAISAAGGDLFHVVQDE